MRPGTKEEFRLVYKKLMDTNNRRAEKNDTTFKVIVYCTQLATVAIKYTLTFCKKKLKKRGLRQFTALQHILEV